MTLEFAHVEGDAAIAPHERGGDGSGRFAWMLALVCLLHLPSLFNPFIIDDYIYLDTVNDLGWGDVPGVMLSATMDQDASGVWWTPEGLLPFYRPLTILTYAVDYVIWGTHPFGYHLTNLLLHLLCTWLVWRLAERLFDSPSIALAAATLFAIHPIHGEAVLWISGRFDVMVCAAVVASILAYLRWREHTKGRHAWGALSVVCFVIALGSKETALILPAMLVALELFKRRRGQPARSPVTLISMGCVFALISLSYIAIRFHLFGGLGSLPPPYGVDLTSPNAIATISWNVAQYLLDFFLFIQIDPIYLSSFWNAHGWLLVLTAALVVGIATLAYRTSGGGRPFWIGVTWVAMFLTPALMAMPGERNAYLASVGLAMVGAVVFGALIRRATDNTERARRLTRVVTAFVGLLVVINIGEHALMWRVANASEVVYRDLLAAVPDPPPNARMYIVNQCPLNAVGFTQGVRVRYGRDDVTACALAVSPQLEGRSYDRLYRTGPASVRIVRNDGVFFKSFVERFLLFSKPVDVLAQSALRLGIVLLRTPESFDNVREMEMELPCHLDDERVFFFEWDNRHVSTLTDLIWRAPWPNLVRFDPSAPANRLAQNSPRRPPHGKPPAAPPE